MNRRRVVVTGMGAMTPVGMDVASMWQNVLQGNSGISPITLFDVSDQNVKIAGEIGDFDPTNYMSRKEARRTDRFVQFAIAALEEVMAQSGLTVDEHNAADVGSIVGTGMGGIETYTRELDVVREKGPGRVNPFLIPMITTDIPSVQIALRTGARGPNFGISSACATSSDAIGQAYTTIQQGQAQAMFCGGVEAAITEVAVAAFDRMRALSRRNDDPASASRPFDIDRDGFVMSEGGALLLLEELDFALARGAEPLAELVGYAANSDAAHIAAPDSEGAGAADCMTMCMQRAGVVPEEISYVNAHATATPVGDPAEVQAIKKALGKHAYEIPVSATKSTTGHLVGGAGALESVICIQALRTNNVPPTSNIFTPDPACDLDCVPSEARQLELDVALTNSFGFGGHNTTLIFRTFE